MRNNGRIICVASHNIMDGLYLEKLLCHYRALKRKVSTIPLVLCIQENVIFDSSLSETKEASDLNSAADVISHTLSYACDKTATLIGRMMAQTQLLINRNTFKSRRPLIVGCPPYTIVLY